MCDKATGVVCDNQNSPALFVGWGRVGFGGWVRLGWRKEGDGERGLGAQFHFGN